MDSRRSKRHKHVFTLLYWHFGPYGDQTVHIHSCFTDDCDRVLIGQGRNCSGSAADHRRETLGEGTHGAKRQISADYDEPTGPIGLLEAAWGLIANAGEGDWEREHAEWREAAARWRDRYHEWLKEHGHAG